MSKPTDQIKMCRNLGSLELLSIEMQQVPIRRSMLFYDIKPLFRLLYLLQVFRTDEYICVYTLHGHADSITALTVDKVRRRFRRNVGFTTPSW